MTFFYHVVEGTPPLSSIPFPGPGQWKAFTNVREGDPDGLDVIIGMAAAKWLRERGFENRKIRLTVFHWTDQTETDDNGQPLDFHGTVLDALPHAPKGPPPLRPDFDPSMN
jgi:hypothetical protein